MIPNEFWTCRDNEATMGPKPLVVNGVVVGPFEEDIRKIHVKIYDI